MSIEHGIWERAALRRWLRGSSGAHEAWRIKSFSESSPSIIFPYCEAIWPTKAPCFDKPKRLDETRAIGKVSAWWTWLSHLQSAKVTFQILLDIIQLSWRNIEDVYYCWCNTRLRWEKFWQREFMFTLALIKNDLLTSPKHTISFSGSICPYRSSVVFWSLLFRRFVMVGGNGLCLVWESCSSATVHSLATTQLFLRCRLLLWPYNCAIFERQYERSIGGFRFVRVCGLSGKDGNRWTWNGGGGRSRSHSDWNSNTNGAELTASSSYMRQLSYKFDISSAHSLRNHILQCGRQFLDRLL